LQATADLLEERRYAEVSIEAIAERAGVVKATIYKWWTCKALLAMEAYGSRMSERIPPPNTGSVERDMRLMLRRTCRVLSQPSVGTTIAGIIAEAQSDPKLAGPFRVTFIGARRELMATIVKRGVDRGELRSDVDVVATLDQLYGPLWYRLLLRHAPLSQSFADTLVAGLLPGLRRPKSQKDSALSATRAQDSQAPRRRRQAVV